MWFVMSVMMCSLTTWDSYLFLKKVHGIPTTKNNWIKFFSNLHFVQPCLALNWRPHDFLPDWWLGLWMSLLLKYFKVKVLYLLQQSYPMRHKEVHFVHIPPALKYVYDFVRSRFSPKMRERCMVSLIKCA